MLRPWAGYLVGAGAVAILAASCTQDFDEFFTGPETVTTTSSGGTSSTTTNQGGGDTGGGGGSTGECQVPDDCPGVGTTCRYKTCDNQTCDWADAAADTACVLPNEAAGICNGAGTCVECLLPEDCPVEGDLCQGGECISPLCTNDVLDASNGETDVDCGGDNCPACINGDDCVLFSDCQSLFCDSLVCAPCVDTGDCADATGTWCDTTGGCVPTEDLGSLCSDTDECTSGFCTDGVCCEAASCGGDCRTCSPTGTCGNVDQGDPCDDGSYCNGADTCDNAGTCVAGTTNPCTGHNQGPNCNDSCNENADDCTGDDADTVSCDDSLYCNGADTCDGNGNCDHAGTPCPGEGDGANCADACDEIANNCSGDEATTVVCDDGLYCTATDRCSGGACAGTGDPCAGNVGDCDSDCTESCDEDANSCTANDPAGSLCDNNGQCPGGTHDRVCDANGACVSP